MLTHHFARFASSKDTFLDETTFQAVLRDPAIVHYTSPAKPWLPGYAGLFREYWEEAHAVVARHWRTPSSSATRAPRDAPRGQTEAVRTGRSGQ